MKVKLLQAKNQAIFERLSSLYETSKKINITNIELRSVEAFMADTEILAVNRQEFSANLDKLNTYSLQINPEHKIDYNGQISFDGVYTRVERVRSLIAAKFSRSLDDSTSQDGAKGSRSTIKLPPIQIPNFDGRIENWPIFYESFKSNIDNNLNLTDSQRVQYLIGNLKGNALQITAGIIPSGENYTSIWNSLVQKYQDKRALGSHYMSNILNIKPATNNPDSLNSFIESFHASVSALEQLNIDNLKDFILLNLALKKLDPATVHSFEMHMRNEEIPTYTNFVEFIKSQVKILHRTISSRTTVVNKNNSYRNQSRDNTVHAFVACDNNQTCLFCNKNDHSKLYQCPTFQSLSANERLEFIKTKRGCVNCLSATHTASQCKSVHTCRTCNKKHHTLLHFERGALSPQSTNAVPSSATSQQVALCASARLDTNLSRTTILLSTAQVYVDNKQNKYVSVRCLIDNASQNNIITLACCKKLQLNIIPLSNSFIKGVGTSSRPIIGYVEITVTAKNKTNSFKITALVVDCITDKLPSHFVHTSAVQHLFELPLADPQWNIPGEIELLLGAKLFPYLLLNNKIMSDTAPSAIETVFGYVLMGEVPTCLNNNSNSFNDLNTASYISTALNMNDSHCFLSLDESLHKFWNIEEIPSKTFISPAERECEQLYASTVSRDSSGRYCTALPFCKNPDSLGNSYAVAYRRLMNLERTKLRDPALRASYNEIIQEYIDQNYLTETTPSAANQTIGYYIAHHPVIRNDKQTTKVRIVLDASAKSHNGVSLNDLLHTGPNLQADIFLLLLNFRLFPIAVTADIKQMYLRIAVIDEHRKYQKILFRFNTAEPVREFQFNRVAFGLKASPFLAMRTVRQLSEDEKHRFPRAAIVASHELYMDDLVNSTPTLEEAKILSTELIALFKAGGFDLTKWASNSPELLESIPHSNRSSINFSDGGNLKILGLKWIPSEDCFTFTTSNVDESCTKRSILSTVARLWDVLGLVAPVVLFAKLLIKELWKLNTDWDETPPDSIVLLFQKFKEQLPLLSSLKLPRHVAVTMGCVTNIVGFADASMSAYGCAIYLHVTDANGNTHVNLVCAKSKVAPVKVVSLARLELCAAVLLSNLIKLVYDTYRSRTAINEIFAFSDSTITLSWIHSSPHKWNIFVSNRVAKCQENLDPKHFFHINGKENPSDCLSRGLLPEQLLTHDLWWHGPEWLLRPTAEWPISPFVSSGSEQLPEFNNKSLTLVSTVSELNLIYNLSQKFTSLNKTLRIIVYILRFLHLIPYEKSHKIITVRELTTAEIYLIRCIQQFYFLDIYEEIKNKKLRSQFKRLDLFIDEHNVIRIGGRLSNANLPYEAQHPALLPKHDNFTHVLIDYYHRMHCHAGVNLLSSLLRQKYWILSSRGVIRQRVHACNFCFKVSPSHPSPKMADLPACRVQETKAFVHTGVDYAGPIRVTLCRRRGQRSQKAYICLFICFVTKAVHIELVTDVSSDTFISAFKRFISRRGPVSCLYSDNGTNFVGAKTQLQELLATRYRIEWKMIPPRAPHFGGLWESNIKSIKTHLYRVIGSQLLTYEELSTVLTEIEAVLNSRPLCVLNEDPYPEPLTPAHFIMASPLTSLPVANVPDTRKPLTCRKKLLDQMVCSFWSRWRIEYLHNLQVRQKWLDAADNIRIGTVVLMHQDDVPPLRWPMGIITEVFPGRDGTTRVAMVKTSSGSFKRPVVKLCPLPSQ